jgi:dTDP-4-dehydrorhamnose reductase
MTRIVLIGRNGQVGWELERCLVGLGDVVALGHSQLDLSDAARVEEVVQSFSPALIVNAAAYTDVEGAETNEATAFAINADAVQALALVAKRRGATLIQYSTDYVFDGEKSAAYHEDDVPGALSTYGRSKLAGEQAVRASGCAHLILRTSWVYAARGRNFLRTILRLAAQRPELRIVDDQRGAPTSARLIAQTTALLMRALAREASARLRAAEGTTVHLSAAGETTWYGFACEARELALELGVPFGAQLAPIRSEEYPTKARRPMNSRLCLERLRGDWGIDVPTWQSGLRLCMEEIAATAPSESR